MIEVHELTKRFPLGGQREITAVDGLSFRVARSEVYGLLGPNGAGKTTTLRMILGLLHPTSGHAAIDGFVSTDARDEVKRRVGLVAAGAGVYQWLTAREMLLFFADAYGVPFDRAQERLRLLAAHFQLGEFLEQRCGTLSTGQKQRVNLARALIHDPLVMLLDEPTLGLDVLGSQAVAEYVAHLRETGKAVILSTHRLDEAERICDRIGLLHKGKLLMEGTLAELRERTGKNTLVEMFLSFANAAPEDAAA